MMLVPRPIRPTERPEDALLAAFDDPTKCEGCMGRGVRDWPQSSGRMASERCSDCHGTGRILTFELAAFDETVICPVCLGRKATLNRHGHAEVCGGCGGQGEVSRLFADEFAARGRE